MNFRLLHILFLNLLIFFSSSLAMGNTLISTPQALEKIFEGAQFVLKALTLTPEQIQQVESTAEIRFGQAHSEHIQYYEAMQGGKIVGYAFEDTVIGKWAPIHYLAALTPEGKVKEVVILDYNEIRGKPIAKRRFLKQFDGKSSQNPLRLKKDINGITGATISSRSLTDGVRKIVTVFHLLQLNPSTPL